MRTANNTLPLRDESRSMGIYFPASKGAGKSRIMGRLIAWEDFRRGIPLVIIDPFGAIIDNFLDKFCRLPQKKQEALAHRILYIDTAGYGEGKEQVVAPFPLLYRTGNESLDVIARRHVELFIRYDPDLRTRPMLGGNALSELGRVTGILLAALNRQVIPEGVDLVQQPERWLDQVRGVQERYQRTGA